MADTISYWTDTKYNKILLWIFLESPYSKYDKFWRGRLEEIFERNVVEVFDAEVFVSVEDVAVKYGNVSFQVLCEAEKILQIKIIYKRW